MVLKFRAEYFLAFVLILAACQRAPEWEMRSDRQASRGILGQLPQYQRWLWTCRADLSRIPQGDEIAPTGVQISDFLEEYRKAGLTVVDALGSKRILGTAVLWSEEGLLITLDHWLISAKEIECRNGEVDWQPAQIMNRDVDLNVALLRISPNAAKKSGRFGSWPKAQNVKLDEEVFVVGSPFPGMIERENVNLIWLKGSLQTGIDENLYLYSPASADHLAGGVLVNSKGEWAGFLNSKKRSMWGKAISTVLLSRIIDELQAKGEIRRLYLGLLVRWVPEKGFVVQEIEVEGAAYSSGVRLGDVILAWDGRKLTEASDWPSLKISDLKSEVELLLSRNNREIQVKLPVRAIDRSKF